MYDDHRYNTLQQMVLAKVADGAIGSAAGASRVELNRRTVMANITVKDFNLEVLVGATCTGTGGVATEVYTLTIGKSVDGTGAFSAIGTATVGTAGQADASVLDGSVTETNLDAGDDIVFAMEAGTALGDNSLQARAVVSYVEHFVAPD